MNGYEIATAVAAVCPASLKLTWSGEGDTFAGVDPNGLVVFASTPHPFSQSGMNDSQMIEAIVLAAGEQAARLSSWGTVKSLIFPAVRRISDIFIIDEYTKIRKPSPYQKFCHPVTSSLVAVPAANLDTHVTMMPDSSISNLAVSPLALWTQAIKNLTSWFRARRWNLEAPGYALESLGTGTVYLFSGDAKCSAIPMIPALLGEVAHEVGAGKNFCFSMPAEGGVLLGHDTPQGRAAVDQVATSIFLNLSREGDSQPLSPEVFRMSEGKIIPTQIRH